MPIYVEDLFWCNCKKKKKQKEYIKHKISNTCIEILVNFSIPQVFWGFNM